MQNGQVPSSSLSPASRDIPHLSVSLARAPDCPTARLPACSILVGAARRSSATIANAETARHTAATCGHVRPRAAMGDHMASCLDAQTMLLAAVALLHGDDYCSD